jgi:hypothetical protein
MDASFARNQLTMVRLYQKYGISLLVLGIYAALFVFALACSLSIL